MKTKPMTAVISGLVLLLPGGAWAIDFLIPGLEVSTLRFEVGSWVRYVSGTLAEGQADSSLVQIGVVGQEGDDLYWVEFVSETPGEGEASRIGVRFLISSEVVHASSRDEVLERVHRIIVQRGDRSPEEKTLDTLADRKLVPILERDEGESRDLGAETLTVGESSFLCRHLLVVTERVREIPLGQKTLIRSERVEAHTWISDQVPFWGLVRSSTVRRSEARTTGGRPFPGMGVRVTKEWARLLAFGDGLTPRIPLPEGTGDGAAGDGG